MEFKEVLDEFYVSISNNETLKMSPNIIVALSDDSKIMKFLVYLSGQDDYVNLFTPSSSNSEIKKEILELLNNNDDLEILNYLKRSDYGKYFLLLKYISLVNNSMHSFIEPILNIARKSLTKNV